VSVSNSAGSISPTVSEQPRRVLEPRRPRELEHDITRREIERVGIAGLEQECAALRHRKTQAVDQDADVGDGGSARPGVVGAKSVRRIRRTCESAGGQLEVDIAPADRRSRPSRRDRVLDVVEDAALQQALGERGADRERLGAQRRDVDDGGIGDRLDRAQRLGRGRAGGERKDNSDREWRAALHAPWTSRLAECRTEVERASEIAA